MTEAESSVTTPWGIITMQPPVYLYCDISCFLGDGEDAEISLLTPYCDDFHNIENRA